MFILHMLLLILVLMMMLLMLVQWYKGNRLSYLKARTDADHNSGVVDEANFVLASEINAIMLPMCKIFNVSDA